MSEDEDLACVVREQEGGQESYLDIGIWKILIGDLFFLTLLG